jgi:hypothetical protein
MAAFALFVAGAQAVEPLRPRRIESPPAIDGGLDDPIWQEAPSVTGFKTYTPDYDLDMTEHTVVYFAYDRENLYFAFRCFDRTPGRWM